MAPRISQSLDGRDRGEGGHHQRALYQHFLSKDALMAAVLAYASDLAIERLRDFRRPVASGTQFIDFYFRLGDWGAKPKYSGAGFTRAVVELADLRGHPARAIPHKHKLAVEKWLAEELAGTGVPAASDRAREVMLLIEGAMVLMLIHADQSWPKAAARAARIPYSKALDADTVSMPIAFNDV